jgi:hypothetical protein
MGQAVGGPDAPDEVLVGGRSQSWQVRKVQGLNMKSLPPSSLVLNESCCAGDREDVREKAGW